MKKFGGIYKYLSAEAIKKALIRELVDNKVDRVFFDLLHEIFRSKFWLIYGYDGASVIEDEYHPRFAYFVHDFFWRTGAGGVESDRIMKALLIMTGDSKLSAQKKYIGVRAGWLLMYKYKHKRKGNVRKLNDIELNVYDFVLKYLDL